MSKLPLEYCKVSYRSGTRINTQDEQTIEVEDDPNKIEKVGVTFDPETKGKKPKLDTTETVTPKLPGRKQFSLKKKTKQKKGVRKCTFTFSYAILNLNF